jgi:DNA (cytosine-5)-methyltransferase 1
MNNNVNVIDLFSGCGGLSLGFKLSGFNIVAAFDNWEAAMKIYEKNFDHKIYDCDLSNIKDYDCFISLKPDCIIGGPPCQDFSSAGKRDENLGRADLTIKFAEIVCNVKPEWFVMENVNRITKSNVLKRSIDIYKKHGYGLTSTVLDASYCNVPQARKRFFLIGHLLSQDGFLDNYLLKNQSQKPMTLYDYFGNELGIQYYYRHPRSYKRRAIFSINEPSPTVRGVNRPIPDGYKKHPGDLCDIDNKVRPLTTIERSYIQTFPKTFNFFGNKTQLEQMIGNAVPVNLAKYVADCIKEYISDINSSNKTKKLQTSQIQLEFN